MLPAKDVGCPWCGESIELIIDDSVRHQQYIEDCSVCCRPISVDVRIGENAEIEVICRTDSEV